MSFIKHNLTDLAKDQLKFTIDEINFEALKKRSSKFNSLNSNLSFYSGKVRECISLDGVRVLIATDRLSVFDVVVSTIPFKGQVLTELADFWFDKTSHIVKNHLISRPHPNVVVAKECEMLPIEVVVRRYLAGSLYKDYLNFKNGDKSEAPYDLEIFKSGHKFIEYERFTDLQLTPTTKEEKGAHDLPISEQQIIEKRIIPEKIWDQVRKISFELFALGEKVAQERGLLLADTKYEFGLIDGEIVLADEIHTLDSTRYWKAESYQETLGTGIAPFMLDKQVVRQWYLKNGFSGNGIPPKYPDDQRILISKLYLESYENITGIELKPLVGDQTDAIIDSILNCLSSTNE